MERKLSVMLIAVFCLLFGGKALAQSTVSGTVFSSEDESPIIGASIKIQGTKMGAATDIDGKFRLENVKGSDIGRYIHRYADQDRESWRKHENLSDFRL